MTQMDLYKAVKWMVQEYQGEIGMSLVDLWKVVTGKDGLVDDSTYWKNTCLETYKYDHTSHTWEKSMDCIVAKKVCKHFDKMKAREVFNRYMNGRKFYVWE